MPDLGRYAVEVAAAYGVSLALLLGLVGLTLWRGAKVRRTLNEVEKRQERKHG